MPIQACIGKQIIEHGDVPPDNHACQGEKCDKCENTFIVWTCQKCEDDKEKQELEQDINQLQQDLKIMKHFKNHPSYNEYNVQQMEKKLAEKVKKYKAKFGELPSSLREDVRGVENLLQMEKVIFFK